MTLAKTRVYTLALEIVDLLDDEEGVKPEPIFNILNFLYTPLDRPETEIFAEIVNAIDVSEGRAYLDIEIADEFRTTLRDKLR